MYDLQIVCFQSADSWDEVTARRRSRSSVRVNSGAAANVSGRVQRPAVGRAQRQTDTPSELCELVNLNRWRGCVKVLKAQLDVG